MSENLENILDNLSLKYKLDITRSSQNNTFANKTYAITDPSGNGIPFSLSTNSDDEISAIDVKGYDSIFLNKAEGFTPENISSVAAQLIEGSFRVKQRGLLRKQRLIVTVDNKDIALKRVDYGDSVPSAYQKSTAT